MTPDPTFCVLVGAYGDHPEYTLRCLNSIGNTPYRNLFKVFAGGSECSSRITTELLMRYESELDVLLLSKRNVNKDPMMASLLRLVDTPYFLWLDDDSWFTAPDWPLLVSRFILKEHPFGSAGRLYLLGFDPYSIFWKHLELKGWHPGKPEFGEDGKVKPCVFATGGCFLANTALVREAGFPDYGMVKKHDDVILGELTRCAGQRLVPFTPELDVVLKVSDGDRRGKGEDTYPMVNPKTGF